MVTVGDLVVLFEVNWRGCTITIILFFFIFLVM